MRNDLARESAAKLITHPAVRSITFTPSAWGPGHSDLEVQVVEGWKLVGIHTVRSTLQLENLNRWIDKRGKWAPDNCRCEGHFLETGHHLAACPAAGERTGMGAA